MQTSPKIREVLSYNLISVLVCIAAGLCVVPFAVDGLSVLAMLACAFAAPACIIGAWFAQEKYRHDSGFSFEFTSR